MELEPPTFPISIAVADTNFTNKSSEHVLHPSFSSPVIGFPPQIKKLKISLYGETDWLALKNKARDAREE